MAIPDSLFRSGIYLFRVLHWSLAFAFTGAYILSEDGEARHHAFGYVMLGLVTARIARGFSGPRHARFSSFVLHPRVFVAYRRNIAAGREHLIKDRIRPVAR